MWRNWSGFCCPYRTVFPIWNNAQLLETTEIWNISTVWALLKGFVEIIAAFSLVFAKFQLFLEIKVLIDDLSHSLRELQNHNRDKLAASFQVSAELREVPSREKRS